MGIEDLKSVLEHDLRHLYEAHAKVSNALHEAARSASSDTSRLACQRQVEIHREQMNRLEEIFCMLHVPPVAESGTVLCRRMEEQFEALAQAAGASSAATFEFSSYRA